MRKSDYPKVHRRGVAVMVILLLLFGAFAPAAMAAWPNCDWIQDTSCDAQFPPNNTCTANDGRINKAWLGYCDNGTPIEPCTPGTLVDNVCIWAEFSKGPLRYQIYSFFDLYIDGQYQGSYCDCNDTIPFKTHVNRSIYGPLQWTCGQELVLKNVLVAWTVDHDCDCSVPACCNSSCDCEQGHPKCWGPKDIIVRAPLVANFTHTAPQCYCTDINFYGTATGGTPSYSYSWDFGDGNSSTGQNTNHHYGAAGTYTVNLTVTDSGTSTSSISKNVQVWPTPVANFTSNSPQIYCYNITFNGSATDGTLPYTYYWDFDDGNTGTEQNTSHRYSASGTYNVNLTVTDANGCTNSTTKPVVTSGYTVGLAITKKANVDSATVGTVIGYTINVSNTGNANLTDVLVTDSLTGLNETIPILAHGATQTFNTTHTVTEPEICAPISNTATANGTDPCGVAVGPVSASVIVAQGYTAGLSVVKDANITSSATIGTVIGYTINVTNTGNVNLSSVLVTDSLTGLYETLTILAPHAFHIFNTTHTVTESDICGWITNMATANGTDPCGDLTPTAVGVFSVKSGYTAALSISKKANVTSATVGTVIGYTINVSNAGNVNFTSVLVTDNLTGLNETIPTLAPGATQTFNTTYTVTQLDICASISNTATANGTDPCGKAVEASVSFSVAPVYDADLSIVKTASLTGSCPGSDPLAVNISDTVTYCFNVTNTGDVNLTGVTVNDDIYGSVPLATTTLAPGETTGGTLTHVVVESDAPLVTNTATANGTDPCGVTVTDTDPCTINVAIAPDIEVIKTASLTGSCPGSDPLAVNISDTVTYCFNVTNTGDVNLTGVTVNDDIYGSVPLATTTLAPGETTGGTITHVVVESDAPLVTNTATATGTDPLGGTVTDTDDCTIEVTIGPEIEIVKTASLTGTCPGSDPLAVSIGDTVTYCFNVTNTGDVNLTGVTVNDNVYGSVTLATTTLAPGETTGGTLTHVVVESDAPLVTDIATATGTDPLGATVTDTDDCTIEVTIGPGIEVVKTASLTGTCPGSDPLAVSIGDTVTYCFNVTNTGDVNLTGVTVNDNVYGPVTLATTTLAPGESTGGTLTHVVVWSDAPSVTDIATATGTDPLGAMVTDTDDCTIEVRIGPGIEVVKTASLTGTCPGSDPLAVNIGDTVTYCFNVTNTGDVTLTGITVNDNIYGPVTLGTTTLAPGETTEGTLTHVVVESDAPSVTDIATATGTDPLGGTVTDTDVCTINVMIDPEIYVNKTAHPTEGIVGTDITYTINVTNTGDCTLSPVKVIDELQPGLSYVSSDPPADTHNGILIWNDVGPLVPGQSTTITVVALIDTGAAGVLNNTVTATGTDPLGGLVTDNDTAQVAVISVGLEKSGSPATVAPGGTVTYTINYTNNGAVPLTNVVITENYPNGVTFISASPAPDAGTNNVWTLGTLLPGESRTIVIKVKVPEQIDLSFTETGSVIGEGVVMVTKDLSTEQKPYSLRNSVTLSCAQLAPESAYATTKVSGVPGTSLGITESGSGVYSSDEILDLETKNKSIILKKTTHAEYKPTTFNFSDSFSVNFTNKWKQDICSKNMEIDAAIHKKISDATYIDDETISRVDKDKSIMNFDSSFNGSLYVGARTKDTEISETYIGEFDVLQTIQIAKGPIPTPAPTPTPTPIWLPCPFNDSQELNTTEDAEPTP